MEQHGKTILFFSHLCSPDTLSGSEKTLLLMMGELPPHYRPVLIVPNDGLLAIRAQSQGIEVRHLPYQPFWPVLKRRGFENTDLAPLHRDPSLPKLVQLIASEQPHAVVANTAVNLLPIIAAKRVGIPVLWWIQEVVPQNRSIPLLRQFAQTHVNWILGLSKATLAFIKQTPLANRSRILYPSWLPSDFEPHRWSPNRLERRSVWNLAPDDVLIGFIALRMTRRKGFHHFIQMAEHLLSTESQVRFLIRSHHSESEFSHRWYRSLEAKGLLDFFHFTDFEANIENFFPALDILVVPSIVKEGFGLTTLEAMIFGKPVVTYNSGALAEIMQRTRNQRFLVPRGNIRKLTQRVRYLVRNPSVRVSIGKANRQKVTAAFGIQSYRKRLRHILRNLLGP
jgi:glycosyltransferase involved in cell wall biosynthesis